MAVNYVVGLKNARLDEITTFVDAGPAAGKLVIGTASLSGPTGILATITLQDPSAAAAAGGVWTVAGTPLQTTASATGTAALAELRDSNDNTVCSGLTVGTSGTDIIINSTAITSGQTVQLTSGTITHSA